MKRKALGKALGKAFVRPRWAVGDTLWHILDERGMNQSELARRMAVSRQAVSYYLRRDRLHERTLKKLCAGLDMTVVTMERKQRALINSGAIRRV